MTDTEVVEQRGEYRAVIQYDHSPSEPENESGCPVLRIDEWQGITNTGYGSASAKGDGIRYGAEDALQHFINRAPSHTDAVNVFDRWLRIWHGGGAVGYHLGYSREYGYVAYVTRRMVLDVWGQTPEYLAEHPVTPELAEWEAYCEGDVFLVEVERNVKRNTTTTTLDGKFLDESSTDEWVTEEGPIGGYYGEDYAREAAIEMLDAYAKVEVSA